MHEQILEEEIFLDNPERFEHVQIGDKVNFLWGYDLAVEITEDDIDHLRNGGVLYFGEDEYSHFIRMRKP